MRIAIFHNKYRIPGGEDAVVEREIALLRGRGHEVFPYFRDSAEEIEQTSLKSKIEMGLSLSWSEQSYRSVKAFLVRVRPTVAHVHNTFPLITPAVFFAAKEAKIPTTYTLHNFRLICANGLFLRHGTPCEICRDHSPNWGTIYGCYRNSPIATAPITWMIQKYQKGVKLANLVDQFIAPSKFSADRFKSIGISEDQIVVKPNFVLDPGRPEPFLKRENFALYVGRLSDEKGIRFLLNAWTGREMPLKIAGTGPLETELKTFGNEKVEFLGAQTKEQVQRLMARASLLIMPSICFETFSLVIIEAWSNGLPVLASRLGAPATMVHDGLDGFLFDPNNADSLRQALDRFTHLNANAKQTLSQNARSRYLAEFTPGTNAAALEAIYDKAIACHTMKEPLIGKNM